MKRGLEEHHLRVLPIAAEARLLLRFAPHLPLRRPVLVIYQLLRIVADALELLLFALQEEVPNAFAGGKSLLELPILLDAVLCLCYLILDDRLRPARRQSSVLLPATLLQHGMHRKGVGGGGGGVGSTSDETGTVALLGSLCGRKLVSPSRTDARVDPL